MRIKFLYILLIFPLALLSQERPNILWLTFEDTSPQFIGCYGNAVAQTPVMDKMASEGVRFTSAFSTGTVCSPSRSAIITGVPTYKLGTGNHRSNYAIPEFIKGFPYYLKQNGYYVTNNHKTDYNVANVGKFTKEAWDESSNKAGWWNRPDDKPFFSVFNIEDSHQSRTMTMSYEWYEKNVLAYLPKATEIDQPTKGIDESGGTESKRISIEEGPFTSLHKPGVIVDDAFEVPAFYKDSPAMRKQLARVYNSLKLADIKMGRILDRLKEEGLMDETIVFIFADHGEGIPRAKTNGIGLGYRVPFIVWFPEKYKHLSPFGTGGVVTDELIDFEDLAPTIFGLTQTPKPEYLEGRTFLGEDPEPAPEHFYLSSDRADNGLDMVRTITDGRYIYSRNFMPMFPELHYIRYVEIGDITQQMREDHKDGKLDSIQSKLFEPRPPEVLYDLQEDPWETHNLVNDKNQKSRLSRFRESLKIEVLDNKDVHFMPEYELGVISKTGTPYAARLDSVAYPLKEIFATVNLVGFPGKENVKLLLNRLKNPNKFIRYWASIGLLAQKENLDNKQGKALQSQLEDEYAPVKITLAALLYEQQENAKAETILKTNISNRDANLALMTINYLLYVKNRKPFVEAVQKAHARKPDYKVAASCVDFLDLEGLVDDDQGG